MVNKNVIVTNEANLKLRKIVYYLLGVLEVLLGFRLVFRLLGANPGSIFVSQIYDLTDAFLIPFNGIFRVAVNQGIETASVLEPTTIIAMIVYGLIGYGMARFIEIWKRPKHNVI